MVPTGNMNPKEGWRDLRRRLPSMNRCYRHQRAVRWAIFAAYGIGAALLAITGVWLRFPSSPTPAESNLPITRAECNRSANPIP
jgi:hypothetical protein